MTIRVMEGDCRNVLRTIEPESVHCCICSPPYWGLRDYQIEASVWGGDPACEHDFTNVRVSKELRTGLGMEELGKRYRGGGHKTNTGQMIDYEHGFCRCGAWRGVLGLEPTHTAYVEHMIEVFREVWRVLRKDGTLWLNLGDSYAGSGCVNDQKMIERDIPGMGLRANTSGSRPPAGLKTKDLCGIPWRVAFALQADGWYLRQDLIWSKSNPMPESVRDRCTKAHEYLFLLAKSERYFYDADAIKEPAIIPGNHGFLRGPTEGCDSKYVSWRAKSQQDRKLAGIDSRTAGNEFRNRRSVWTVATAPFAEAHFATYPPALIEPMILAGTSAKGCCAKCGAPWVRKTSRGVEARDVDDSGLDRFGNGSAGVHRKIGSAYQKWLNENPKRTTSWAPLCSCDATVVPCTVLDPFAGVGTTGLVADRLQRNAVLIEASHAYSAMARNRIIGDCPMFVDVEAAE